MKKIIRIFLIVFLFFFKVVLVGQTLTSADSLLHLADTATPEKQADYYLQIFDLYLYQDPELALKYGNDALHIVQEINDKDLLFQVVKRLGSVYMRLGKMDLAETYLLQAHELCEETNNALGLAESNSNLGSLYAKYGDLEKSKNYYEKSLSIATSINDTTQRIRTSLSLGATLLSQGNYEDALQFFNQAIVLSEGNGCCAVERAQAYNNIGVLFSEMSKYHKSLEYYKKALVIYDSLHIYSELGRTYNNIGNIYLYIEDYDSAKDHYIKSLKIRKKQKDIAGEAYVFNNLGMLIGGQGDLALSKQYFDSSLVLFEKQKNKSGSMLVTYNLGELYTALKQYRMAEKHYHQSLSIARLEGSVSYELANLESLTSLYKQTGEYKKAVTVFEQYTVLSDSLSAKNNAEKMIELEARFDQEKKKTTLNMLQKRVEYEKLKARKIRWATGVVSFLFLVFLVAVSMVFHKQKQRAALQKHQLSQQFLQYQLNPGFLYQSLTAIRNFLYKNKSREAGVYLSNFARLIRTFIDHSTSEQIDLETELETIEQYFKLRRAGFESAFKYQLEMDEGIEPEFIRLPPFLLFPFLDVLLGRFGLSDSLSILIRLHATDSVLQYKAVVLFSGSHYLDLKSVKQHLENVAEAARQRIRMIEKLNKKKIDLSYRLDTDNEEKKLELQVRIPL